MRKNNPRILIIGTGDLRNYGCEAIVQGTYSILKKTFPECSVFLASDNKDYDRTYISFRIRKDLHHIVSLWGCFAGF